MRVEKIDSEGLLVDLIQYSLNYHHKNCKAFTKITNIGIVKNREL